MKRVLVTAFKPFNNLSNNYSMDVLNFIDSVDKLILDVLYDEAYYEIINNYNLDDVDLIVALGEARMRDELTLEVVAKNIASCSIADNNGVYKKDEIIIVSAPSSITTDVDVNSVKDIVKLSNDAGKFVCNNLYYYLLYNCPSKAIFIHIPNCYKDEEIIKKYAFTIKKIIKKILKED